MKESDYYQTLSEGRMIDINHNSKEECLMFGRCRFRKGQIVLYEGEKAEIIDVKPLLIIKVEDRIICGALAKEVEFI